MRTVLSEAGRASKVCPNFVFEKMGMSGSPATLKLEIHTSTDGQTQQCPVLLWAPHSSSVKSIDSSLEANEG